MILVIQINLKLRSHRGRLRRETTVDGRNVRSTAIERVRTLGTVSKI